ncbi:MAG: PfkB family carbohydrate kinase [Candidatus Thermoplasmatota archaeon]|jgi:ribokinase|nr:PfkB family carbohydrate kinase [Candidatus Thermoplasmatota archaeon]
MTDCLLVCGNLNVDRIYTIPYIPAEGQSAPVLNYRKSFGGCGGNISLAASRLGARTFLSTVVGRDLDPSVRERLEGAGVDLSLIVEDPELPSPYCIILSTPEGKQSYAFCEGAMSRQKDLAVPFGKGTVPRYVHIATSHPDFASRTAEALSERGSEVSLDPGQELFFRWDKGSLSKVLPRCRRLFGNMGEWKELGNLMGWKATQGTANGTKVPLFPAALDMLSECIVTMGEHGSFLYDRSGVLESPPFPVAIKGDVTGAGDAYRGAFYAALLKGYPPRSAIRFGDAMGSVIVSGKFQRGADVCWEKLSSMVEG